MPKTRIFSPKRIAVGVFLLTVAAAFPGITMLHIETDAAAGYIPRRGPEAEFYRRYLDEFIPDFGTLVIATGDVWRPDRWQALCDLSEELEGLDVVERVIGLPNAEYVTGTSEQVEVEDFADLVPEAGNALRDIAVGYKPYIGTLVTPDGRAVALYVPSAEDADALKFDSAVTPIIDKYAPVFKDSAGGDLFQSGDHYVSAEIARLTASSNLMIGASMLIMFIVASIALRSIIGGLMAVASGIFGAYFTFALMGYLGLTQNSVNSLVLNLIIPYGTAYTIHAVDYVKRDRQFFLGIVPVSGVSAFLFAGLSTMIGFGMTAISTVQNIIQFGLLGAFGVLMIMYTTALLTFPITARLAARQPATVEHPTPRLILAAMRMSKFRVVSIVVLVLAVTIYGALQTRVNYEAIDYLLPGNAARINADRGTALFSRHTMPLVFSGAKPGDALDPATWAKVDALLTGLERDYAGLRTSWLYDQVEQLSLAFTADEPEPTAMPRDPDLIAQYLVLFDEHDLEPYVDSDRKDLNVVLGIPFRNSASYNAFHRDLDRRLADAGLNAEITGRQHFFFEVGDLIAVQNLQSVGMGLAVLFVSFALMARSARVGGIATLVNAVPVAGCIAVVALLGFDMDIGSSIVAAVALGMVVDDTGHLITRYRAHRSAGLPPELAANRMVSELWYSVAVTTTVIAIGFSVANLAPLVPFHTFSRTLTATMILAVFCDLLLLPALLIQFDREQKPAA